MYDVDSAPEGLYRFLFNLPLQDGSEFVEYFRFLDILKHNIRMSHTTSNGFL